MEIKRERVYIAEIDLTKCVKYMKNSNKIIEKIVKYPEVTRDLAIVLSKDVLVGNMIESLKKCLL